jgi:predicted NBD/HSP70 family sugar kinase
MLFGTNLEHGQRYNRRVVLEAVRVHGPLSRAEIARRTRLSAQTVSNLIDRLKEGDLFIESARRTGGRGQPPIDITINPAGAYSFGASFDHDRLTLVALNLGGEVCGEVFFKPSLPTPSAVLPLIEAGVKKLIASRSLPQDRIWGIGVALPTLVSRGSLTALGSLLTPDWRGFPLSASLQERLRLPVIVDNDATAGAIGELLYGAGRKLRNFFYVYMGVGLGGGVVINGLPYRGGYGMAGEIAHLVSAPGGRSCSCGNHGCLERYASLSAAQSAVTGRPEGAEPIDIDRVVAAFHAGDTKMMRWLDECAGYLRNTIVNIENLFDPEAVVIGGLIPADMLEALLERIGSLPQSVSSRHNAGAARLLRATHGVNTRALGAAALAMFDSLTPDLSVMMKRERSPEQLSP